MLKVNETYALNEANIDKIAEQANAVCQSLKMASDQRLRVRLLLEEVLLEWFEKTDEPVDIAFKADTQFFKPVITLSYASPTALNPLKGDDFGVPLGIVIHKVATAINYVLIAFYIAGMNHIECSLSWIIMAVIISAITAIATPPIPGGTVIGYTMLFTQLGLPEEALAIALAIDVVTDFFTTSTNIFCLPMALTGVARRYALLDVDRLRD